MTATPWCRTWRRARNRRFPWPPCWNWPGPWPPTRGNSSGTWSLSPRPGRCSRWPACPACWSRSKPSPWARRTAVLWRSRSARRNGNWPTPSAAWRSSTTTRAGRPTPCGIWARPGRGKTPATASGWKSGSWPCSAKSTWSSRTGSCGAAWSICGPARPSTATGLTPPRPATPSARPRQTSIPSWPNSWKPSGLTTAPAICFPTRFARWPRATSSGSGMSAAACGSCWKGSRSTTARSSGSWRIRSGSAICLRPTFAP